jgi:hypothetical protein
MYEGGHLSQGRICHLRLPSHPAVAIATADGADVGDDDDAVMLPVSSVMRALRDDGVDLDLFYAAAYEHMTSTGGWMPLESGSRFANPWNDVDDDDVVDECDDDGTMTSSATATSKNGTTMYFAIPPRRAGDDDVASSSPRRIDVKLFRRPKCPSSSRGGSLDAIAHADDGMIRSQGRVEHSHDALGAISASVPSGRVAVDGYFGIGVSSIASLFRLVVLFFLVA